MYLLKVNIQILIFHIMKKALVKNRRTTQKNQISKVQSQEKEEELTTKPVYLSFEQVFGNPITNYSNGIANGHLFALANIKGDIKVKCCTCKDFIQDYFWSSYTGNDVNQQYGYSCKAESIQDNYIIYLAFSLGMGYVDGKNNHKGIFSIPTNWTKNLELFIYLLSSDLGLSCPTGLRLEDGNYTIQIQKDWTEKPYLLSLLTYCIRIGCYTSYYEFLEREYYQLTNPFVLINNDNTSKWDIVRTKLNKLIQLKQNKQKLPDQKWTDYTTQGTAHNSSGIISYNL